MRINLLPSQISTLDAQGSQEFFSVAVRWDSTFLVVKGANATLWPGKDIILAIAPERCLRRRLHIRPTCQSELKDLAANLFPFDLKFSHLALHQNPKGLDVCVLAENDAEYLVGPAAVIVAEPDALSLSIALHNRLLHGEAFDFIPGPKQLIGPTPVFAVANISLLVASVAFAIILVFINHSSQDQALKAEDLVLQEMARPLQATAAMLHGSTEFPRFAQRPDAVLIPQISEIAGASPKRVQLNNARYTYRDLIINSPLDGPKNWLLQIGQAEDETRALKIIIPDP